MKWLTIAMVLACGSWSAAQAEPAKGQIVWQVETGG